MKTRAGITLIEVLIAIFIMAIGLLALMTLFPLGALSMAQAIKDERVGEAAQQANAIALARNIRVDPSVLPVFATTAHTPNPGVLPTTWDGPSYPVFVDPWYVNQIHPVAPYTLGPVVRSNLSFTTNRFLPMWWCGLQDELSFQPNGTLEPVDNPTATGSFDREPRTTWAYWLRQPNFQNPKVVEMSIVVYSGRNLLLPPANETVILNSSYLANPTLAHVSAPPVGIAGTAGWPDPSTITVNYNVANNAVDFRRGMWIVDVTFNNPNVATTAKIAKTWGPIQGSWYRIVEVVDTGANIVLEVQPKPPVSIHQFILMEGVADVFNKGTGWK